MLYCKNGAWQGSMVAVLGMASMVSSVGAAGYQPKDAQLRHEDKAPLFMGGVNKQDKQPTPVIAPADQNKQNRLPDQLPMVVLGGAVLVMGAWSVLSSRHD